MKKLTIWQPPSPRAASPPPGAARRSTRFFAMSRHGFIPGSSAHDGVRTALFAGLLQSRRRLGRMVAMHKGDHPHDYDYLGRPGPARYAATRRKTFTLGVAGPVGSGRPRWSSGSARTSGPRSTSR